MRIVYFLSFVLIWLMAPPALAQTVYYQGQLFDPSGNPVTASVNFRIQIYDPSSSNCVMYAETQTADLSTTNGYFSLAVGQGTRTDGGANTFPQIFSNSSTFSFSARSCASGTTYTPAKTDGRKLIVSFETGSMGSFDALPVENIEPVPFAMEALNAESVGGTALNGLLSVVTGTTTTPFTAAQYTTLQQLIEGTATQYLQSGTNGAALPSLASNPSAPVAGDVWYDSTNHLVKYYDGTSVQTVGSGTITGSSITSGTIGGSTSMSTTGTVTAASVSATSDSVQSLQIFNTGNTHKVTMTVPASLAADYPLQLPAAAPTVSGQVLSATTAGAMSWQTAILQNGNALGTLAIVGTTDSNGLELETNNIAAVFIDTSQRVGIGTTVPATALDINGAESLRGMVAPAVSPAGQGRIYFDSTTNHFMVSESGSAYALFGSGNVSANGGTMTGELIGDTGTAATPSFGFTGDTTTGFYDNGSHAIAVANSGVQSMTLSSTGITGTGPMAVAAGGTNQNLTLSGSGTGSIVLNPNVGIGTTTPAGPLDIEASNAGGTMSYVFGAGTSFGALLFTSDSTANYIESGNNTGGPNSKTLKLGAVGGATYVTIAGGTGDVGIGTSAPATILDVNGAESLRGMVAPAVAPAGQGRIYFDSTANHFMFSENGGGFLQLGGGSLPTGGGTMTGELIGDNGTSVTPSFSFTGDTQTGFYDNGSHGIAVTNSGVQSMTLSSTGIAGTGPMTVAAGGTNQNLKLSGSGTGNVILTPNVGIGTTNPTAALHVAGTAGSASTMVYVGPPASSLSASAQNNLNGNLINFSSLNSMTAANGALLAATAQDNTLNNVYSVLGYAEADHTSGNKNELSGVIGLSNNNSSGSVNLNEGVRGLAVQTGTATTSWASSFYGQANIKTAGVIQNSIGLYLESQSAGTNNYQIYSTGAAPSYFAGNIGIGTTSPASKLDVYGGIDINGVNAISFPAADNSSIAIGGGALNNFSAVNSFNTGVGYLSMANGTMTSAATQNTTLGYLTLNTLTTGYENTAIGAFALSQDNAGFNNTGVGYNSLGGTTSGNYNTAVGSQTLAGVSTGNNNSSFGYNAGAALTSGSNNLILGPKVGATTLQTGSNNILIGTSNAVDTPSNNTLNFLNIGNTIFATGMTGTGPAAPAGQVGINNPIPISTLDVNGHIGDSNITNGTILSGCTNGSSWGWSGSAGNDLRGTLHISGISNATTACTITFGTPYSTSLAPTCVVSFTGVSATSLGTNFVGLSALTSYQSLVITVGNAAALGTVNVSYICMQ